MMARNVVVCCLIDWKRRQQQQPSHQHQYPQQMSRSFYVRGVYAYVVWDMGYYTLNCTYDYQSTDVAALLFIVSARVPPLWVVTQS